MSKMPNPEKLLFDLGRSEGADVVHLPYTPGFEEYCRGLKPDATLADMHRMWEEAAKGGGIVQSTADIVDQPLPPQIPEQSNVPSNAPSDAPAETTSRRLIDPAKNRLLFEREESVSDAQPWSPGDETQLPPEKEEQRQKLLAHVADSQMSTQEQRVASILQKYPETRDSDVALSIRYWRIFQPEVFERWKTEELEILFELERYDAISRSRRHIQNDLRMFRGLEDTRRGRNAMQIQLYEYLTAHKSSLPEIRFYLDETGGELTYSGIAGICVINWKQFEKYHASLSKWRTDQGWIEPIHFAETGEAKSDRAVALMQQLDKRKAGVLFLGYALMSRGRTYSDQFSLFIQLVVDSLKFLRSQGCLPENRCVRVIKEAQDGFDQLHLRELTAQLSDVVALEFPGEVTVLPVEAWSKGRTVLLECADVIAGGMQRRALYRGWKPKDQLAEAIVNVTGFEDPKDPSVLFKYFAAR